MRNASLLLQGVLDPTFAYANYKQVVLRHSVKRDHLKNEREGVKHRPLRALCRKPIDAMCITFQ